MQTQKEIKNRINSTQSINKITKALFLMSTVKSQKALKEYNKFKEYIGLLQDSILRMENSLEFKVEFKHNYYVVLTSDLGLAGSYNIDVTKKINKVYESGDKLLLIGKKANSLINSLNLSSDDYDYISLDSIRKDGLGELTNHILKSYRKDGYKVSIVYSKFLSQLDTESTVLSLLPLNPEDVQIKEDDSNSHKREKDYYDFEPKVQSLYPKAISIYLDIIINWLLKEADLSEQVSRKQAMDSATRNGQDMIDSLKRTLNKTRQAKITQEISEIIGAAEALK